MLYFFVLFFCVVFFVIFFDVVLKSFHSIRKLILVYFWQLWGQNLKNIFFQELATRTDSLPCDLPVFISKLS